MLLALPTLETERLVLRPFHLSDGPRVKELAGAREVYETTLLIPHPYPERAAEKWIAGHASQFLEDGGLTLAVTLKGEASLIGAIGLGANSMHRRAELGYWIGVSYWGNGYCTEAARAVIAYGFSSLGYHKIRAHHLACNPASGRVMAKAGMRKEAELEDEVCKDGIFHTIHVYSAISGQTLGRDE